MAKVIPERMAELPMRGSLPVGYIFGVGDDGVPDFTVLDMEKLMEVVIKRRCGMCGKGLDYWIAFVGGDKSITNRMFTDPAMHEECARYALSVCPFLLGQRDYATRDPRDGLERGDNPLLDKNPPQRFGMLVTRSYDSKLVNGYLVIQAARPMRVEWFQGGEHVAYGR